MSTGEILAATIVRELVGPKGPKAVVSAQLDFAVQTTSKLRNRIAAARREYKGDELLAMEAELRRVHGEDLAARRKVVEARLEAARTEVRQVVEHTPQDTASQLQINAAWDRVRPYLERSKEPVAWLERRVKEARAAGRDHELAAIRREAPDFLEAAGNAMPPALRRNLQRAAGDEFVGKALDVEADLERGAYRAKIAFTHLADEIAGNGTAPAVPGWGADEILEPKAPEILTTREIAAQRVAAEYRPVGDPEAGEYRRGDPVGSSVERTGAAG